MSLLDTIVEDNDSNYGGGIWASGAVRAEGSVIRNNVAEGFHYDALGGGINARRVRVVGCEISGNRVIGRDHGEGGGVSANLFAAVNSTIAGNHASAAIETVFGGGISADGVGLTNSTVTGNTIGEAYDGGGGGVSADTIRVRNSLIVGNAAQGATASDDVRGIIRSDGLSLVGGDGREIFAEATRIAPGIFAGVLGENGGLTRTVALRFDRDNPAIGGADPETATPTDQRGVARDARPDLGAFEATRQSGVTIVGGERSDLLWGTNDPDRLAGAGGGDTIIALAASDLLFGGDGDDILKGGRGADGLRGGSGADRLTGGRNDDVLGGGSDSDRFVFRREFGSDSILDFDADPGGGQDHIDLRPLGISAADFDTQVTITDLGPRTLVEIAGQGTILCAGVSGRGENRIDVDDFLFAP